MVIPLQQKVLLDGNPVKGGPNWTAPLLYIVELLNVLSKNGNVNGNGTFANPSSYNWYPIAAGLLFMFCSG
jgi:hypothetical protein